MRGFEPLIDEVGKKIVERDRADNDVRSALREVSARETKQSLASELGLDGVAAVEQWDHYIEKNGPAAARHAAELYATAPRILETKEQDRHEGDHEKSARAAYRQVADRERRQANMPATLAGLDRIQQRHGSLDVVNSFKRWDQQLRDNPAEYVRVGQEIANNINDSVGMQQAHALASDYQRQNPMTDEERQIAAQVLQSRRIDNLPLAHGYAKWVLANDIKDEHTRAVIAARRAGEGPDMFLARINVAEFESRYPNARKDRRLWGRMQQLLETSKARSVDEAYQMARG
jgi:hypothetical protein